MILRNFKLNKRIYILTQTDFINDDIYLLNEEEYRISYRSKKLNKENPEDYWRSGEDMDSDRDGVRFLFGTVK